MKTLVGAAAQPSSTSPIVMIVDSTPAQREFWREACDAVRIRHHFVGVDSAVRRLRNEKELLFNGVILDPDIQAIDRTPTPAQRYFFENLKETGYDGPLAVSNMEFGDPLYVAAQEATTHLRTVMLSDFTLAPPFDYSAMLYWCLSNC